MFGYGKNVYVFLKERICGRIPNCYNYTLADASKLLQLYTGGCFQIVTIIHWRMIPNCYNYTLADASKCIPNCYTHLKK